MLTDIKQTASLQETPKRSQGQQRPRSYETSAYAKKILAKYELNYGPGGAETTVGTASLDTSGGEGTERL